MCVCVVFVSVCVCLCVCVCVRLRAHVFMCAYLSAFLKLYLCWWSVIISLLCAFVGVCCAFLICFVLFCFVFFCFFDFWFLLFFNCFCFSCQWLVHNMIYTDCFYFVWLNFRLFYAAGGKTSLICCFFCCFFCLLF